MGYESNARAHHRAGNNCSVSLYKTFAEKLGMSEEEAARLAPPPRSEGGKCGAVLAAEQYIREAGRTEKDIEEFERQFKENYKYLTCAELRGKATGQCNDYVGLAASIVGRMGIISER